MHSVCLATSRSIETQRDNSLTRVGVRNTQSPGYVANRRKSIASNEIALGSGHCVQVPTAVW